MRIAVICTVLNEESTIADLLDSLGAQTRAPDEIVVVDGGSTDRTVAIVQRYLDRGMPIRLIEMPGANIAAGRNRAIASSIAEVIASTDAGVRFGPQWLACLVEPFERLDSPHSVDVVAGFFQPDPRSSFEAAMGATVLPALSDVDPECFLPSSRSIAFTKKAWARVEGYPEWLDYCEDVVFDLALRRAGCRFVFVPAALVAFRPRSTLGAFFRQYYRYSRGDGKANLWPRRHFIRYASYVLGALALALGFWYKESWFAFLIGGLTYLYHPYRRLLPALGPYKWGDRLWAIVLVPVVRLVGDFAKMAGYPVGVLWRNRRGVLRA